ncbi:hypothetical protein J6TS7_34080 [Paenibacillus dendritiformis]|nr:hypothetical protein J6TS7_34080 [Paenibacillus dendritiformis]
MIDISIGQEAHFFDFKRAPWIIGKVPNGMSLVSYREDRKTVKEYGRLIARQSGLVYLDWIKKHDLEASSLFLNFLNSTSK